MHESQVLFCRAVKSQFPDRFNNVSVIDFGSLDINGNNRYLFEDYEYVGVDLGEGKNVDVVCRAHEYEGPQVDVVISTEMLEHDEFWAKSIQRAIDLLKPEGLLVLTCASTGRPEHGTTRTSPDDAPFTNEYYCNLSSGNIGWGIILIRVTYTFGGLKHDLVLPYISTA